ncbi:putative Ig domain-containing protein, partial [Arthrospira platensis SPKY1]|nr:putative Ig domain-containing protein [Arthrospira platensis SPKY1]
TTSIPVASEAQPYEALIEAFDADGHALTFSVGPLPGWLSFTDNGNGTATLSGTPNFVGTYQITVTVSDGFQTDEKTFSLVVNPRPRVGFTVSSAEVAEDAGSL